MTHSQETETKVPSGFTHLGIAPQFLEALEHLKFHTPTPIQQKAIPPALEGNDVVGIAQTGTGKTLAFGIPMMQRLAHKPGRGLILAPTRELAMQIQKGLLSVNPRIKTAVLIGGASMHQQIMALRQNPPILIATPGRLFDHIQQKNVSIHDVNIVVLDEADRMFDMGFAPQVQQVFRLVSKNRQTLIFSATMPPPIMKLATSHMKLPIQVEIAKSGTIAERLSQELFVVKKELKSQLLKKVLDQYKGTILLFSRTRIGAMKITKLIRGFGHSVAEIHADRSFGQRKEALEGFRTGKYRILVATDIAARGIDVTGIELVINYDLPDESESYIHRIGRTGRAGHPGHAISFATPDQGKNVKDIERLMRMALPISEHPEMPLEKFIFEGPRVVFSGGGRGRFKLKMRR